VTDAELRARVHALLVWHQGARIAATRDLKPFAERKHLEAVETLQAVLNALEPAS
jgi:hypothetical protein